MMIPKLKIPLAVIAIYMLSVGLCIIKAFDFAGAINTNWTLALIVMTLPWSIISILFAWALIHGAGLEFFALLYLSFAGINAAIFYRLCLVAQRGAEREKVKDKVEYEGKQT
jgi:hypothetical protein